MPARAAAEKTGNPTAAPAHVGFLPLSQLLPGSPPDGCRKAKAADGPTVFILVHTVEKLRKAGFIWAIARLRLLSMSWRRRRYSTPYQKAA